MESRAPGWEIDVRTDVGLRIGALAMFGLEVGGLLRSVGVTVECTLDLILGVELGGNTLGSVMVGSKLGQEGFLDEGDLEGWAVGFWVKYTLGLALEGKRELRLGSKLGLP